VVLDLESLLVRMSHSEEEFTPIHAIEPGGNTLRSAHSISPDAPEGVKGGRS